MSNMVKEQYAGIKGYFKIQSLDNKDNVISEWAENNMIMNGARSVMMNIFANLHANLTPNDPFNYEAEPLPFIDKIILGVDGFDINTGLVKTYDKFRTQLFSEELGSYTHEKNFLLSGLPNNHPYVYDPATFTKSGAVDQTILVEENGSTVTFSFDLLTGEGNGTEDESIGVKYSEAGLYANGTLFAMRIFNEQEKNSTVKLRIIWAITF